MTHIYRLTVAVMLFGGAHGLMVVATPQAVLGLKMSSLQLGLIGAGIPLGYGVSCLLLGRITRGLPGKYVLCSGAALSALGALGMSAASTDWGCLFSQMLFGLASGAFWPFASSWMLEFSGAELPKTAILRCYNIGWTSGTAAGMYTSGVLAEQGYVTHALLASAALAAGALLLGLTTARPPHQSIHAEPQAQTGRRRIAVPILLAAITCNLTVLATRTVITFNYAELNRFLNFSPERIGILIAFSIGGQLLAFGIGRCYEPLLGMRRLYIGMALVLIGINLLFAYTTSMLVLVPAMLICGMVAAIAFQTGILAATEWFSSYRSATTFHEAMIGFGGLAPFFAGILVQRLKESGMPPLQALRAPFLLMAGLIGAMLILQLVLISSASGDRVLLARRNCEPA